MGFPMGQYFHALKYRLFTVDRQCILTQETYSTSSFVEFQFYFFNWFNIAYLLSQISIFSLTLKDVV